MAKKKPLFDEDEEMAMDTFDPMASAGKLPVDVSGGKKPINNYMEVPCHLIIEYRNKKDSDFRPYPEDKFQLLVDSIKESGVIEAVTIRALPDGTYEMLAGEHRWKASIAAGKETIPAHVIANISDQQAEEYFSVTNIIRRDASMLDRINGWWHYYESHGHTLGGKQGSDADMVNLALEINNTDKKDGYTKRHIYRYIKMHDLIQPLKERLDAPFPKNLTLMAGYWLSSLPEEIQKKVSDLNTPVSESKAAKIKKEFEAGTLTDEVLQETLCRAKKDPSKPVDFRALNKQIKKAAQEQIAPQYLHKAGKIFAEALEEYLNKHPELKNVEQ